MSVCASGSSLPGPIPRTVRDPAAICVRPLIKNVRAQLKGIVLKQHNSRVMYRPGTEVEAPRNRFQSVQLFFIVRT